MPCTAKYFIKQIYELRPRPREQSCNKGQVRQGVSTGEWKRRKLVLPAGGSSNLLVAKIGLPWPSSCSRVVFPWTQWSGRSRKWSIFLFVSWFSCFLQLPIFFDKLRDFCLTNFFFLHWQEYHYFFISHQLRDLDKHTSYNSTNAFLSPFIILCWLLWLCHRLKRNKTYIFVMIIIIRSA